MSRECTISAAAERACGRGFTGRWLAALSLSLHVHSVIRPLRILNDKVPTYARALSLFLARCVLSNLHLLSGFSLARQPVSGMYTRGRGRRRAAIREHFGGNEKDCAIAAATAVLFGECESIPSC